LGASFDSPEENRAFATAEKFDFPLLSDVERTVGAAYQVVREVGEDYADFAKRIAYLIDSEGVIRRAYEVTDVAGFAGAVLGDLDQLR
jgi:peroxiredoxin Q/BCP